MSVQIQRVVQNGHAKRRVLAVLYRCYTCSHVIVLTVEPSKCKNRVRFRQPRSATRVHDGSYLTPASPSSSLLSNGRLRGQASSKVKRSHSTRLIRL